jgi:ppGpp synthetase/RelA/SpoT-type nucleotidyltranferase
MENTNKMEKGRQWVIDQINHYDTLRPRFVLFASVLQQILDIASKQRSPLGIIQSRAKTVCSFAEKAQRKHDKYEDPVYQFTDLCGARVITHTYTEVEAMCRYIEENFVIDAENSVQIHQRLKPSEFGYRSVHYVVQFKRNVFPNNEVNLEIPEKLYPGKPSDCPMKAEIQVRTLLEHAWAVFSHERVYKGSFDVPESWQRELAGLAAMLEEADKSFLRIQDGLQRYSASYGDYLTPEEIRKEIDLLKLVQECEAHDPSIAHKIAHLAIAIGDWQEVIHALQPFIDLYETEKRSVSSAVFQPILRDMGIALCKAFPEEQSQDFQRGQTLLKLASEMGEPDVDTFASLAGTYKKINDTQNERVYYRKAYQADPTDPYAVENCLVSEVIHHGDLSPVQLMMPAIHNAMKRCQEQVDVGMNIPWAHYSLGMLNLLLGNPHESVVDYAKAVQMSTDAWMVGTALRSFERLSVVKDELQGFDWIQKVLLLSWAARFPDDDIRSRLSGISLKPYLPIQKPVIILAGGTDSELAKNIFHYHQLILDAFQDFQGTVISGGTKAGIAEIAGDLHEIYPAITTIGYLPSSAEDMKDDRYSHLQSTPGSDFSLLEMIHYWIDIINSGVRPPDVKLLAVNGGLIAAAEYRFALALGGTVGVITGSGREADALLSDWKWAKSPNLIRLDSELAQLHAFINPGSFPISGELKVTLARGIHDEYRKKRTVTLKIEDPAMKDWDELECDFQQSNLDQVDHIPAKLRSIGCILQPISEPPDHEPFEFLPGEIEVLARMEHARWMVSRYLEGWKFGPYRDARKKTNPYLIPWEQLPEEAREWDYGVVTNIPGLLQKAGYKIIRIK